MALSAGVVTTIRLLDLKPSLQVPCKTVINLSGMVLSDDAVSVLQKGLNFAPTPKFTPVAKIVSAVEQVAARLPPESAEEIRRETCRALTKSKPMKSNITSKERAAIRDLRERSEIVVLPADKGNATVVVSHKDYTEKMQSLLNDDSYRKISVDPTQKVENKTWALLKDADLPEGDARNCYPKVRYRLDYMDSLRFTKRGYHYAPFSATSGHLHICWPNT